MSQELSQNTQAILLLTAPLITPGRREREPLLTPREYQRLAGHLQALNVSPADLISPQASELVRECASVVDVGRLEKLLARGFALAQAVESWNRLGIWVVSRADAAYPKRLKSRLRLDSPPLLYGAGPFELLNSGGLAMVGSRAVDDELLDYTRSVGALAASAGATVVSGGARGVDAAAMRGGLDSGGKVCGVLADSLGRTILQRDYRDAIVDQRLTLVSPYDPSARFLVGHAMARNKLIYALADLALVVNSDLKKGGTWNGAIEQLEKHRFLTVFVRSTLGSSPALDALQSRGAQPWPNFDDADSFQQLVERLRGQKILNRGPLSKTLDSLPSLQRPLDIQKQIGFQLASQGLREVRELSVGERQDGEVDTAQQPLETQPEDNSQTAPEPQESIEAQEAGDASSSAETEDTAEDSSSDPQDIVETQPTAEEQPPSQEFQAAQPPTPTETETEPKPEAERTPAQALYHAAKAAILQLLDRPMAADEISSALEITSTQARAWLQRLEKEGALNKLTRPVRYEVRKTELFPSS